MAKKQNKKSASVKMVRYSDWKMSKKAMPKEKP